MVRFQKNQQTSAVVSGADNAYCTIVSTTTSVKKIDKFAKSKPRFLNSAENYASTQTKFK